MPIPSTLSDSLAAGHLAFALVLAEKCERHDADRGRPCWRYPGDHGLVEGACGPRVALAMSRKPRRPKSPRPMYNARVQRALAEAEDAR